MSGMHYRWFDEEDPVDAFGMPLSRGEIDCMEREQERAEAPDAEHLYTRGEKVSIVLAAVLLLTGLWTADERLFLISAAFLLYEVRKLVEVFGGKQGHNLANVLKGFSIVLFFGAFFLAFS